MAFIPGKFGRVTVGGVALVGSFRWGMSLKRDRLDTTNFESSVSGDGFNVFSEGVVGVLDTTANIEGYVNTAQASILAPAGSAAFSFLFLKSPVFGYQGVTCDILDYSPGIQVRDRQQYTAQVQTNGSYSYS